MDIQTIKEKLGSLHKRTKLDIEEIENRYQETSDWLKEIAAEAEKHTSKSSFLLPKTPTARRRLRKRGCMPNIPEYGESEAQTSTGRKSSSTTHNTRSTRSARQNSEKVSPVLITKSGRKTRTASKKLKLQINQNSSKKAQQSLDGCESGEEARNKRVSTEDEEDMRPLKCLRLERLESLIPVIEKLGTGILAVKTPDSGTAPQVVKNCVTIETSGDGPSVQQVGRLEQIKSMVPLVERLSSTVTQKLDDRRIKEEKLLSDSPIQVTSSVNDDFPQTIKGNKMSEFAQNIDDDIPTSTVNEKIQSEKIPYVLLNTTVTLAESTSLRRSARHSSSLSLSSCDEPQKRKFSSHSALDMFSDSDKKSNVQEIVPDCDERTMEVVLKDVAGRILEPRDETGEENECEGKKQEIEVDKIVPTSTSIKATESMQNAACPRILNGTEVDRTSKTCRSPSVMISKLVTPDKKRTKHQEQLPKSTVVFSPYANEPVRERVAAFEKLRTLSEEPAEQSPQKQVQQPMRVTRTKTRAMAAAAAAAAESTDNPSTANTSLTVATKTVRAWNTNLHKHQPKAAVCSENTWKAARKSVSKAKKISLARELRQKAIAEEPELSKENSSAMRSASKYTPYASLYNTERYRNTPLSSSNISNTSANSSSRLCGVGTASRGRYLMTKHSGNIVVGVESFLTKQVVKSTVDDIREKREDEIRRRNEKEEEVRKKREQRVKERIEEKKRKREEKMMKVFKTREALEKQRQDQDTRFQKEKEEKLKQMIKDRDDKLKEQVQQKKQNAQQKAVEIEERRKQEETARLARLKEQEEEQRRLQATRKKEQEEAEKQHLKRLAEEKEAAAIREQQAAKMAQMQAKLMKEKQTKEAMEVKVKAGPSKTVIMDKTFEMPPPVDNLHKKKVPNTDDYGIDDTCGDSSEDEDRPKKPIPLWAKREERFKVLRVQAYKVNKYYDAFFNCEETTPDLTKMFKPFGLKNIKRTSSAVWRTPPRYSTLPKY